MYNQLSINLNKYKLVVSLYLFKLIDNNIHIYLYIIYFYITRKFLQVLAYNKICINTNLLQSFFIDKRLRKQALLVFKGSPNRCFAYKNKVFISKDKVALLYFFTQMYEKYYKGKLVAKFFY